MSCVAVNCVQLSLVLYSIVKEHSLFPKGRISFMYDVKKKRAFPSFKCMRVQDWLNNVP